MTEQTASGIQGERLDLLYQLSRAFNSTLDLDEVLDRVMDEVIRVMGAERGFLMLVGAGEELEFVTARGLDHSTIEDPEFQISRGIVRQVAVDGLPLLTSDAGHDVRFLDSRSVYNLSLRSILCVPLQTKGRLDGMIYVDNRFHAGIFRPDDLEFLAAIAANAAIAIENARLYKIAIDQGRMERELQMAHQVQASLLPRELPSIEGWEFEARWMPALEVAGDYYDLIPAPDGKIYLVIGDVTDKGM
ncbi:MAG TPA: GAF domain-containing protein, partial [Anaerolineales bacterium]|nr:GAF domain-containing protein [Anaerolineales bacterium]